MADHDGDDADETSWLVVRGPSWTNYPPPKRSIPRSSLGSSYHVTIEKFKKLILSGVTTVPVSLAQVTVCGLPQPNPDLPFDLPMLVQKFIVDQLGKNPEEPEKHRGFTSMELAAFKTKQSAWRWESFSKRNGYLPCFVSALECKRAADINRCVMEFDSHYLKQYVFDCQPLDDCFHDVYRLLSSLYKDESTATQNLIDELRDGARIALVNVWVITYSRSILHFLNVLRGYLRSNFPILIVNHPWDQDIDECIKAPNEPLLQQYTCLQYLLQFTHLARSAGSPHESSYNPCQVAAVFQDLDGVHTTATERKQFAAKLQASFEIGATKFGATGMLNFPPSILDPDDPDRNKEFKETVENLIKTGKKPSSDLPLSWIFFHSAFFKTGQLYIRTSELRFYAALCNITGNDFKKLLCEFTACGSIIHIPDIPVFCDYVILNPTNFFYKLNELFYPRFNGDLKYGIVTLSTLKMMYGGDHVFFHDVLTSCTFAAEIDSSRIEYADTERGFVISGKCLFFPAIRTGELEEKYKKPLTSSLFLLHGEKLQPTNITVNVVQFLIENESSITHLTSQCLTLTQFRFNSTTQACEEATSMPKDKPVLLSMISHGNKNEIRIEGDQKGKTHVKKLIIRAYLTGIEKYRKRYRSLFYDPRQSNPITQFALTCLKDESTMHKFSENHSQQVCSHCDNIPEFKASWQLWREIISEQFEMDVMRLQPNNLSMETDESLSPPTEPSQLHPPSSSHPQAPPPHHFPVSAPDQPATSTFSSHSSANMCTPVQLEPIQQQQFEERLQSEVSVPKQESPTTDKTADYIHNLVLCLGASKKKEQQLQTQLDTVQHEYQDKCSKLELELFDMEKRMAVVTDKLEQSAVASEPSVVDKGDNLKNCVEVAVQVHDDSASELVKEQQRLLEQWQKMGHARDQLVSKLENENEALQAKLVKVEASRRQLQTDLKEENKLQAELVRKVQLSRLKDSLISQKSVSIVDTSVQANYLAVAPDFLRGAEVYGETVLEVVGDKPQKLQWPGYGFYLEVPDGALAPGVTASVAVKMILSGQFKLPENSQLISAIYWISSSKIFLKEVAVNIQHCAVISTEEQCSKFRFIVAKCSQKVLPYTFREREGSFNVHTQYAAIKVKQFSVFAGTGPKDTELFYTSLVFYKPIPDTLRVDIVFVIVPNLESHLKTIMQDYAEYNEDKQRQLIHFEEDAVELDLPIDPPAIVDHWKILPLTYPKIDKADIQQFQSGRHLTACNIEIEWTGEGQQQAFSHRVMMKGVKKPNSFFQMRYYPKNNYKTANQKAITSSSHTASTQVSAQQEPQLKPLNRPPEYLDLLNKVATRVRHKWEEIGMQLSFDRSHLKSIWNTRQDPVRCFADIFDVWQRNGSPPYTWATIIDVLRAPIVGEVQLASELEEWIMNSTTQ